MLRGCEAGTNPFVCRRRVRVAVTVCRLVRKKPIEALICVVNRGSLQEQCAWCDIENKGYFCPYFMTQEFKIAESHAACCGNKTDFVPATELFRKNGPVTRTPKTVAATCPRSMSPIHVPDSCPLVCAEVVWRGKPTGVLKCFKLTLIAYLAW